MITPDHIEAAHEKLMGAQPPYSVYVHGAYHYYGGRRARFVRWVLTNIVGLSVSLYDHDAGGWYILQNSRERARVANLASRLREAQAAAETRSAPPEGDDMPPASGSC